MIRVNLLKNRVAARTVGTQQETAQTFASGGEEAGSEEKKEALVKLILIFTFSVGVYFYEQFHIDGMNEQLNQNVAALNAVQAELAQKKAANQAISHFEKDAKVLEQKLEVLKGLSSERLRMVKMLDYIQNLIPERVWLSNLVYDKGEFSLAGLSVTDDDLSEFIRGLEETPFFTDVILTQAKESSSTKGTYKIFEMKARLGK